MSENTQSALERYNMIIATADALDKMASDDAQGGPSYWRAMRECTGGAIADCMYKAPKELTYGLNEYALHAIYSVSSPHMDAIWKDAAAFLRNDAQRLKDELLSQQADLVKAIAELENKSG